MCYAILWSVVDQSSMCLPSRTHKAESKRWDKDTVPVLTGDKLPRRFKRRKRRRKTGPKGATTPASKPLPPSRPSRSDSDNVKHVTKPNANEDKIVRSINTFDKGTVSQLTGLVECVIMGCLGSALTSLQMDLSGA